MTAKSPAGFHVHGNFEKTPLLAGILPRHGQHFLTGKPRNEQVAIISDLAVAVASDPVSCALGPADKAGGRSSLSGFFGHTTGEMSGVAIITSRDRSETLSRAITAAALSRGIGKRLPVAVAALNGMGADHLMGVPGRLHALADWMLAEHNVELGLVILDGLSFSADDPQGTVGILRATMAIQRAVGSVLTLCDKVPATGVTEETVILEVGDGRLTAAKTASGEPWARQFDLEGVTLDGAETFVLKPGKAVAAAPAWQAAAPVVIAPVAKKPEPQITSKVAVIRARGELSPEMRARWSEQGFVVVENTDDALPKPGEIKDGERRLIQVDGIDQNHADLISVANRLRWKAIERGISDDVVILPAV